MLGIVVNNLDSTNQEDSVRNIENSCVDRHQLGQGWVLDVGTLAPHFVTVSLMSSLRHVRCNRLLDSACR